MLFGLFHKETHKPLLFETKGRGRYENSKWTEVEYHFTEGKGAPYITTTLAAAVKVKYTNTEVYDSSFEKPHHGNVDMSKYEIKELIIAPAGKKE